jgi:hypothetical protein
MQILPDPSAAVAAAAALLSDRHPLEAQQQPKGPKVLLAVVQPQPTAQELAKGAAIMLPARAGWS